MFSGIIVPLVTPFSKDLRVDVEATKWLVQHLIKGGVHGIFPNSTTGEFPHLRVDEVLLLVKSVVEVVKDSVKVIPGITYNYTYDSIELGKKLIDLGVDGFIIAPPYYFKLDSEKLKRHFASIAESLDKPIIIYNIPETTGINIPLDVYLALVKEYSNVVGTKITSSDFTYLRRVVSEVKVLRRDFKVLTGLDELILPALIIGCDGGVLGLANIVPRLYVELYESWVKGDITNAIRLYKKVVTLSKIYDMSSSIPSGVKAVLNALGTPIKPYVRPPLTTEPKDKVEAMVKIVKELGVKHVGEAI